ncbi:transcription initiation factor TFIID subunit 10 [Daktulosphaira vitifoliae]|uniref:transcription initiation factor TFIID subunit 10 n=1 Tax=Daktulosphaira vitifoliae TaxID=58002 RepID=UPI0021AAB1CE|nr:transcription initiation factor TFIID subunit 10 [Daktulosphaira vitifoliae]
MPVAEETVSISDVIIQLQDYSPTIPDAITAAICSEAGFETSDPRIIRLISIASQKFIADIANDALQHCRVRMATMPTKSGKVPKDRKFTLTMEDLTPALNEYGIVVRKPPYFV